MSITSALVLYAVLWFMTFLVAIPIKLQTQGDVGNVVEGTHASSPEHHHLKKKAWITTGVAFVLWSILFWVISTGQITVRDFDWMNRLPPVGESSH